MPTIKSLKKEIEYGYHKWKKQLLIAVIVLVVLLFGLFGLEYVLIASYFLLIPYLIITKRKILLYHLMVASVVAIIWMFIARREYGYNQDFHEIAGISLFPLFAWALGLFVVYVIYSHYKHVLKKQGFVWKLLLFSAFYLPLLITIETVAYHVGNIQNEVAAACPGLVICDCIHAPPWMQAAYLLNGAIFFTLCFVLGLENSHVKNHKKT